ncbi:MAG TPA: DUF3592 domain-containing protein, partial [Polyangiaceae bacterium]|nr:DUF3592 domain-containing protein [Polyangiaceae bacterium]
MNTSAGAGPRKRSVGVIVGGLIALLVGGGLVWLSSRETLSELSLRSSHQTVDASVVDTRIMQSRKTGKSYEVQYRFSVPGSRETYSRRDETGRDNLWTSLVDEETWREARRAGRVRVMYRADDPWVNRPEKAGAMPLGDNIAGLILGLVIALPGLLLLIFQIRGPRAPAAIAPRPPLRLGWAHLAGVASARAALVTCFRGLDTRLAARLAAGTNLAALVGGGTLLRRRGAGRRPLLPRRRPGRRPLLLPRRRPGLLCRGGYGDGQAKQAGYGNGNAGAELHTMTLHGFGPRARREGGIKSAKGAPPPALALVYSKRSTRLACPGFAGPSPSSNARGKSCPRRNGRRPPAINSVVRRMPWPGWPPRRWNGDRAFVYLQG